MLQGLIESERNEPPYSIGLLGTWGAGKSSIKALYLTDLADAASPDNKTRRRSALIFPITFNAWRFGGPDIKRALLRQVYLELGGNKAQLDDALFRHVQRAQPEKKSKKEFWYDVLESWGWSLLQAILVLVFFVGVVGAIGWGVGLSDKDVFGWLLGASVVCAAAVVKFLLSTDRFPRRTNVTRIEAPASAAEEYEDLLVTQLHCFKKGQTELKTGKHCERIVVFVDDLDRLSPEEMIGGLDAVRTFMELPNSTLPRDLGIVFVISCDEDRIAEALANRRKRLASRELPGAVFTQTDAHRYLDRIFQFRMEIPPFPKRDMRTFAEQAIRQSLPELETDLEKSETSLEILIDRMIHVGVGTPRNAIQIVNCFMQNWWIAKRRELDGAGSEREGALQPGAVTKHPIALGAICALRVDFPDFFRELQKEPELIRQFSDVFVRHRSLESQPESIQTILRGYSADEKDSDVRVEHRPLRQFIASIQGIRWPKTLRPLLFLSQDPVTRKYGDRALDLHEAFVSGDVSGVLQELGRENDAKLFSEADMRLLHDMVEDLNSETVSRRNDAAFVLASLTDRFPKTSAHLLLSPLARRLSDSPELRWRLGVENIGRIISMATLADRRVVATRLVEDLLKPTGKTDFKLTSLEPPSLDEAMQMAQDACTLALSVHRDDGLDEQCEARLLDWLVSRQVAIESGVQTIPFEQFETWVAEHEQRLLPLLNGRYPAQIAEEIESRGALEVEMSESLRRSKVVFDRLLASGEESRPELWGLLTRFIQHGDCAFVEFASDYVLASATHASRPGPAALTEFLEAFGDRLQSPPEGLDLNERGHCFTDLVLARKDDLQDEAKDTLAALVSSWGNDDTMADLASTLVPSLHDRFPDAATPILNDWISRVLSNLPNPCIAWLARSCGSILNDSQHKQLVQRFNPVQESDNVPPDQAARYIHFMHNAPAETLEQKHIQSHLQTLCQQIAQRHANPNDYLNRVFPVVPLILGHVPAAVVASTLNGLFPNVKKSPDLLARLHGDMEGHWPKPNDDMPGYNPEQLFDDAAGVLRKNPAEVKMPGLLRSISSMVKKGVVPSGKQQSVVNAACVIWRHHSDVAKQIIAQHKAVPDASLVAAMTEGISEDDASYDALEAAWSVIGERNSVEHCIETAIALLQKPSQGTPDEPDRCLRTWLGCNSADRQVVLEELLLESELNDEQRKRAWLQSEAGSELPQEFYVRVIPGIATLENSPATTSEMLEFHERITSRFPTQQSRSDLGTCIVKAFQASASEDIKARLAKWLKEIDNDGAIKQLLGDDSLGDDDIDILRPHFGKTKYWKQMERNRKKDT